MALRAPAAVLCLCLAACALPAADAAPTLRADLIASLAQTDAYQVTAPLTFLLQNGTDSNCALVPGWAFVGSSVVLQNDTAEVALHAANPTPAFDHPQTTSESHGLSSVVGVANRASCRWALMPLDGSPAPTIEIHGRCAIFAPSDKAQISHAPLVSRARPDQVVDASSALRMASCPGATFGVTGDFELSLWACDFTLTDNGHTEAVTTGNSQLPLLPAQAPDASMVVARDQESFLIVHGGTFTGTLPDAGAAGPTKGAVQLYVGGAQVQTTRLHVEGASGHLTGPGFTQDVSGSNLDAQGPAALALAGASVGLPFQVHLTASPQSITVDGHTLPVASSGARWPWAWLFGGLGAVLAPAALAPVLRRSARHRRRADLQATTDALAARLRLPEAHAASTALLDAAPDDAEAHHTHATILGLQRNWRGAFQHRSRVDLLLGDRDPYLKGENAFQAALLALALQDEAPASERGAWRQQARACLQHALQVRPDLEAQMPLYPALATLAGEPDA